MLSDNILSYGIDEPLPEQTDLRAGPLRMVFEQGDLRYIKLGGVEILRRVYIAVRDRNWGTVVPVISNLSLQTTEDSFRIAYDADARQGDIDFYWRGELSGDASGTVRLSMDGLARSTFLRNRIGFCVLHPMSCAGEACRIEHIDGTIEESQFPTYIAPQLIVDGKVQPVQPFEDMRAMAHRVLPGVWAEVRFEGEIFEMEDQRNWTDASYKTYGTPHRLPYPVEVRAGTEISQRITLTLQGELPQPQVEEPAEALTLRVGDCPSGPLPRIGLGVASHGQALSLTQMERLRSLNLSHLRVDLDLTDADYQDHLRRSTSEAAGLGLALEVALLLSDAAPDELEGLSKSLEQIRPPVRTWLVFHKAEKSTSAQWVRLAREALAAYDADALFASGTDAFFAEVNRERPPVQALDLVTYSINPQVHAFDNRSLVETLPAQAVTVKSAQQFSGDRPVMISPVTLKMRFNPNATAPEPPPAPGELPSQVDERQMSLFGAIWTAGSLKYLMESGVHSATYFETTGWRGVMETTAGSPVPDKFRSLPGSVFPLYHAFADVMEFSGGDVVPVTSPDALQVDALAVSKDGKMRILVANMSEDAKDVNILGISGQVWARRLDATTAEEAMLSPELFRAGQGHVLDTSDGQLSLHLLPYSVTRLDFELPGGRL